MLRLPFPARWTLIGAEGSQVVGVVGAQMRQVRKTARSRRPVQDHGPSGPARRWVFLGLFPGPGRQGPWNWKEHTRSLALVQTSVACGDRFLSLLTLRFHSCPEVKVMHCTDPPRVSCGIKPPVHTHRLWGPQRPPSRLCLTQLPRGEWTWVGGVCGSAPSRPGGRAQDTERFHHRHGPPSTAVTPPPPALAPLSPLHPSDRHLGTSYTWNPLVCAL